MCSQSDHEGKKNLLQSILSCLEFFKPPAVHPALDAVEESVEFYLKYFARLSYAGYRLLVNGIILLKIWEGKGIVVCC